MRILFVASTGGHLAQLNRLSSAMPHIESSTWLTFESEQSKSLLAGRPVVYVPYISPRGIAGIVPTYRAVHALLRQEHFDRVVSTGAGIAIGAFLAARVRRIPTLYIESVSRVNGPSLTGKLTAIFRLAALRTQHRGWAHGQWRIHPSVLSEFEPFARPNVPERDRALRIFVTLGTISPYRFDTLVDSIVSLLRPDDEVIWQLGETCRDDLPGVSSRMMSAPDFAAEAQAADVVVTHAGVGTILDLLERGIHPVVVPRRQHRAEHVDNHQAQISALVASIEVATVREATEIDREDVLFAAAHGTRPKYDPDSAG